MAYTIPAYVKEQTLQTSLQETIRPPPFLSRCRRNATSVSVRVVTIGRAHQHCPAHMTIFHARVYDWLAALQTLINQLFRHTQHIVSALQSNKRSCRMTGITYSVPSLRTPHRLLCFLGPLPTLIRIFETASCGNIFHLARTVPKYRAHSWCEI